MTMTFLLESIKISGIGGYKDFYGKPTQTEITCNFNTDGIFTLAWLDENYKNKPRWERAYGGPHIDLTLPMFDEIITAFEESCVPEDPFKPFYRGTIEPHGMRFWSKEVFGYLMEDKKGMTLESRLLSLEGRTPISHIEQISLTLEEFKECSVACKNYKDIFISYG